MLEQEGKKQYFTDENEMFIYPMKYSVNFINGYIGTRYVYGGMGDNSGSDHLHISMALCSTGSLYENQCS